MWKGRIEYNNTNKVIKAVAPSSLRMIAQCILQNCTLLSTQQSPPFLSWRTRGRSGNKCKHRNRQIVNWKKADKERIARISDNVNPHSRKWQTEHLNTKNRKHKNADTRIKTVACLAAAGLHNAFWKIASHYANSNLRPFWAKQFGWYKHQYRQAQFDKS